MSFTLKPHTPARRQLRHIICQQLKRAETCLRGTDATAVHEARKAVKKVRAIVRLLHLAHVSLPDQDERRLRAASRVLSSLRDSEAVVDTFDRLSRRFPKGLSEQATSQIRRRLVRARCRIAREALERGRLARAARTIRTVRRSVRGWGIQDIEALDLAELVTASYRASRKAMKRARKTTHGTDLHLWRKRVKTLWYQLRLIEAFEPDLRTDIQRLQRLESLLGDYHNLTILRAAMAESDEMRRLAPATLHTVRAMSRCMQEAVRRSVFARGQKLLAAKPRAFARRLGHLQ